MLEVKHLTKQFGDVLALDDLSFTLEEGRILGLIGRNGSGKTTLFRLLLNFITPSQPAVIHWNGQKLNTKIYEKIGYMPEERGLYEKMTVHDQILYLAKLRGMTKKEIEKALPMWLERLEVKGKPTDKISKLSKGNQQKVQLIATLIHQPKFIILDEPFSGLDPVNADLLCRCILSLRDQGSSIIFSSHNMQNVEDICDDVLMVHYGKTKLQGSLTEIKDHFKKDTLYVKKDGLTKADLSQLEGVIEVTKLKDGRFKCLLTEEAVGRQIFARLSQDGYLSFFSQEAPSLEEVFKKEAVAENE